MSVNKDKIIDHIRIAISRFSDEMSFWSKKQFEQLISSTSIGGPYSFNSPEVFEALKKLESNKVIKFIGNDDYFIIMHPEYVKQNLTDYEMTATLKQVEDIIAKYKP
ncbi:MAG: hypothetical protein AB8G05_24965 [Oligoflexales bacterium]